MDRSAVRSQMLTRVSVHAARDRRISEAHRCVSKLDVPLMVLDSRGHYRPATVDQILSAARSVIDQKMRRGTLFDSPSVVQKYLCAKLAGLEHEVFAVLFLDTHHQLIEYVEMFRGTIDGASVHPREIVKQALRLNTAAVILAHNHTQVEFQIQASQTE